MTEGISLRIVVIILVKKLMKYLTACRVDKVDKVFYIFSMKNKKVIVFFMGLVILGAAGYSEVINLSKFPRTPSNHPWVLAYGDKVMVVWREEGGYSGSERNIYYTIHSGSGWSSPRAAFSSPVFSKNPHLALGPGGVIHMTWADGNARPSREVYHGVYRNGKWTDKTEIYHSPNNSNWPRVGMMSNVPNVIWTSEIGNTNEHYIIRNNWKIAGSWNRTGKIVSDNTVWTGESSLATHNDLVCKDNKAYAVWQQGTATTKNIMFSEKEGTGNWSSPLDISGDKFTSYPGIAVDSNNNLHVIASGLRGRVWGTSRLNGEWTEIHTINQGYHNKGFVDIDIDKKDQLHAVYTDDLYPVYNCGNMMGIWGKEQQVSQQPGTHFPALSADDYGYVHIVWCTGDEGYNGDVMYTRIKAGSAPVLDSPVAIFTHTPEFGKPPLTVTFDASQSYDPDGTIVSYSWDFGDSTFGSGVKPSHTYSKRGVYIVTLTVKDNDGLPGTAQSTVYVSDPPLAAFTMNPSTGVAPVTIHFDASPSYDPDGTIAKYFWDFDDGEVGSGKQVAHTYTESGDYNVALEVFDNYGISSMTTKLLKILRVHPPLNIQYSFKVNRNLFSREYFYDVTWERNPLNPQNGVNVVSYRVYRRVTGILAFTDLATLPADRFYYWDRNLLETDENRFVYTVTAVDDQGNESLIEGTGIQAVRRIKKQIPPPKER